MINRVILVGRLGKDPEGTYLPNGGPVVNFSVATDESWKGKDGNKQDKTEWHNIKVFGKLAEICAQYLVKGKLVYLEGKIQTSTWEDKEGAKHYKTEIVANTMKMLDSRGGDRHESSGPGEDRPDPLQESDVPF
jgi:single-strand DNA-binding protein